MLYLLELLMSPLRFMYGATMMLLMDFCNLMRGTSRQNTTKSFDPTRESFFNRASLHYMWSMVLLDAGRTARIGYKAPNAGVMSLNIRLPCKLLAYMSEDRPLVINFGSLTSPSFVDQIQDWRQMVNDFKYCCDFIIVYVQEAHPADNFFRFGTGRYKQLRRAKSIFERIATAEMLSREERPGCPILVDSMRDTCFSAYGAQPERLAVIHNGVIEHVSGSGPWNYNMHDLRKVLCKMTASGRRISLPAWSSSYQPLLAEFKSGGALYGLCMEGLDSNEPKPTAKQIIDKKMAQRGLPKIRSRNKLNSADMTRMEASKTATSANIVRRKSLMKQNSYLT